MLRFMEKANRKATSAIRRANKIKEQMAKEKGEKTEDSKPALDIALGREIKQSELMKEIQTAGEEAVGIMKSGILPVMIRRTSKSQDFKGEPINALPELHKIVFFQDMSTKEREVFQKIETDVADKLCVFSRSCFA